MSIEHVTDMDIKNPEVEEDWVSIQDDEAAGQIFETEKVHTALTELANRVDGTRDQESLEAFHQQYQALVGSSEIVALPTIALETFAGGTLTKKSSLAKAIRVEAIRVSAELTAALESYASDIKEDFAESIKTYDQANRKLRATDADIEEVKNQKVEVNHQRIFDMFMVKDVFKGGEPIATIRTESQHLERLVQIVGRGVERIRKDVGLLDQDDKLERNGRDLPDLNTVQLMFNRKAKVSGGQFETDTRKTRGPKRSYSWGQHAMLIFGGLMFQQAGYNLAKAFNHKKKDTEAKVSNSLTDIHKFIRHVEGLDEVVDDLASHVQDLVDLFKQVNDHQESALNRRVVPVMELANFIMKQIVDITKGTDTLFTRLVRKHSK